jgi:hypothetical protein
MSQTPSDRTDALARAAKGELLNLMDLAAILHLGRSRAHLLHQRGAFDVFKATPRIGTYCFSGMKVYRYVQGEAIEPVPVAATMPFGRKRRVS